MRNLIIREILQSCRYNQIDLLKLMNEFNLMTFKFKLINEKLIEMTRLSWTSMAIVIGIVSPLKYLDY